jgi:hypothetical protein
VILSAWVSGKKIIFWHFGKAGEIWFLGSL